VCARNGKFGKDQGQLGVAAENSSRIRRTGSSNSILPGTDGTDRPYSGVSRAGVRDGLIHVTCPICPCRARMLDLPAGAPSRWLQGDTAVTPDMLAFLGRKALRSHEIGESFAGAGSLVVSLSPPLPVLPQLFPDPPLVLTGDAAFLDPLGWSVFRAEIRLRGFSHRSWWVQSAVQPASAPLQCPCEYPCEFGAEVIRACNRLGFVCQFGSWTALTLQRLGRFTSVGALH
jgi:hypothetical protein